MAEYNFPYIYNPSLISTKVPEELVTDLLGFTQSDDAKTNPVEGMHGVYWLPYLESVNGIITDMYSNWREMFDFEDYECEFKVYTAYMQSGDHIMTHSTSDAFSSFILWLNIPKNGEKLTFTYPLLGGQIYHNSIDITPEDYTGTMIMFPGYLNYSIYPKIEEGEIRIAIIGHVIRHVRRDTIV